MILINIVLNIEPNNKILLKYKEIIPECIKEKIGEIDEEEKEENMENDENTDSDDSIEFDSAEEESDDEEEEKKEEMKYYK